MCSNAHASGRRPRPGASELNHDDPSTFTPPAAFGPFRVLHQIGSGVLGPVFRTYEPERDRLIAVKAFRIELLPEQSAQLAAELQRIVDTGLAHPAVVQALAAGMEGHLPYLAQEYVAAESLDIAMKHYAPAVPARVMPFLQALAGAIDAAAAAGIFHGGLHPRDVFVTTDEARATGFGIVQAIENIGFRAPTRRPYTAPERVAGEEWGVQADVFSLAAIAHELLTGRRPAGPGDQDGSFAPEVPAEHRARIRDVFARALAENPDDRHESAAAFVEALEAAAEGQAVAAPPTRTVAATPLLFDAEPEEPDDEPIEPIEPIEPTEPSSDPWPPQGFQTDDPDVIAERETDVALGDFDLDLNRVPEPSADVVEPSPLEMDGVDVTDVTYDTAVQGDEAPPIDTSRPVEPVIASAGPFGMPERAAEVAAWQPAPVAPQLAAPQSKPIVWMIGGVVIGFVLAWFVFGGTASAPTIDTAPETITEQPLGSDPEPVAVPEPEAPRDTAQSEPPSTAPATVPVEPAPAAPSTASAAPAEPPASSRATTGRLLVRSTPSNAMVVIDGVWSGRTPFRKDGMTFGRHTVRVVLDGYEPINRTVEFSAENPSRQMTFELVRSQRAPNRREPGQ